MGDIYVKPGGGGGIDPDELNAQPWQVLSGTKFGGSGSDDPQTGTMVNHTGKPNEITNTRVNNNRFEVAVSSGYHGCYWDGNSYEYMPFSRLAGVIGLTPGILRKGYTVAGVAGDAWVEWTGGATAEPAYVLNGKTYWKNGVLQTGTMPGRGAPSYSLPINGTQNIASGYYSGGKVTQSIATLGGQSVTPSKSTQTVATSGKYMTGNVVVGAIPSNYVNMSENQMVFNYGTIAPYMGGIVPLFSSGAELSGSAIKIKPTARDYNHHMCGFAKSVNLTPYKHIKIRGSMGDFGFPGTISSGKYVRFWVGVTQAKSADMSYNPYFPQDDYLLEIDKGDTAEQDGIWTLDISALSGHYFIVLGMTTGLASLNGINSCWGKCNILQVILTTT